jgi:hypothetical protein
LENYLWKYVEARDDQIDNVVEAIYQNFEKYILDDVPEPFEIEEIEGEDNDGTLEKEMEKEIKQLRRSDLTIMWEETFVAERKEKIKNKDISENLI